MDDLLRDELADVVVWAGPPDARPSPGGGVQPGQRRRSSWGPAAVAARRLRAGWLPRRHRPAAPRCSSQSPVWQW